MARLAGDSARPLGEDHLDLGLFTHRWAAFAVGLGLVVVGGEVLRPEDVPIPLDLDRQHVGGVVDDEGERVLIGDWRTAVAGGVITDLFCAVCVLPERHTHRTQLWVARNVRDPITWKGIGPVHGASVTGPLRGQGDDVVSSFQGSIDRSDGPVHLIAAPNIGAPPLAGLDTRGRQHE